MGERSDGYDTVRTYLTLQLRDQKPALYRDLKSLGGVDAAARGKEALSVFLRDEMANSAALERALLEHALPSLAIWFPVQTFQALPYLLPHVRRENDCRRRRCPDRRHVKRGKGRTGEPRDLWSTPDAEGYVLDDNSLVKECVKRLRIASPNPLLIGRTLGREYVACHIEPMRGAQDPWDNSRVANLVWLPSPLDKLSDRQGSTMQHVLRETSRKLVLAGQVPRTVERHVHEPRLSSFVVNKAFIDARVAKIERVTRVLEALVTGRSPESGSGHSHYDLHWQDMDPKRIGPLARRLRAYLDAVARRQ